MSTIYDDTHEMFRASFGAFVESELAPRNEEWERAGAVDRQMFLEAGKHGFLGMAVDEAYGGGGIHDFRFNAVIAEVLASARRSQPMRPSTVTNTSSTVQRRSSPTASTRTS